MTVAAPQSVSLNGQKYLAIREAFVSVAYRDGGTDDAPRYSIGFGSQTPLVRPGDTITLEQAFERKRADIRSREGTVNSALNVVLEPHEFDALFSLYYQGGSDGLLAVAALYNVGKKALARKEFMRWDVNAAGVQMNGLTDRRIREMIMSLDGYYGDLTRFKAFHGNPREVEPQWMTFPEEG